MFVLTTTTVDIEKVMAANCRVSVEGVKEFHDFAMDQVFNELPEGSTCELTNAFSTFTYLQMRYVIQVPNSRNLKLSFILLGTRSMDPNKVFQNYLKCDFAFLNEQMDKQVSGVRVLEGELEPFKSILYKDVIPMFNRLQDL